MELKEIKFATNIGTNGGVVVQPRQFYMNVLKSLTLFGRAQTLLNVGTKSRWGNVAIDRALFPAGCDYTFGNTTLSAKEISACQFGVGIELCKSALNTSFFANYAVDGRDGELLSYIGEIAQKVATNDLALVAWQGDTASADPVLQMCDGLNKKLNAVVPAPQQVAGAVITSANVIAEMKKVYDLIPGNLVKKMKDLKLFVAPNIAMAYKQAVASASAETYMTKDVPLTYLGIEVVIEDGMLANTMVLCLPLNIGIISDVNSFGELNIHDMNAQGVKPVIRVIGELSFGVDVVNETEFVLYGL